WLLRERNLHLLGWTRRNGCALMRRNPATLIALTGMEAGGLGRAGRLRCRGRGGCLMLGLRSWPAGTRWDGWRSGHGNMATWCTTAFSIFTCTCYFIRG